MATIKNLEPLERGDSQNYYLEFEADITGWIIYFTMKKNYNDSDDAAILKKDITVHIDPVNGKTKFTLTHEDTKDLELFDYYYDIQIRKQDGITIKTPMKGHFEIVYDVTNRTS